MNLDWLKPLLELLNHARPPVMTVLAALCTLLLFMPPATLAALGLDTLVNTHRGWFGALLLLSLGALAVMLWDRLVVIAWDRPAARRRMRQRLRELTEPEKRVLRPYLLEGTRTQALFVGNGVVLGLEAAGVLRRAGTVGDRDMNFDFNLTPEAWRVLQGHPALLDGATRVACSPMRD